MMQSNTNVRPTTQTHNPSDPALDRSTIILNQSRVWCEFVLARTRTRHHTVYRKALDSVAFSFRENASSFSVPTKLAGTSQRQEALVTLQGMKPVRGHRLGAVVDEEGVVISFAHVTLGRVYDSHVQWLRPLLGRGATVHFLEVTGCDRREGFLGLNVAFAGVARAIYRLRDTSGDGAATAPPEPADEDIRLWRNPDGSARTNVFHIPTHSASIDWGGENASCVDLARSILMRFVGPGDADRLCEPFMREILSQLPSEGGTVRAALIRSWLSRKRRA